MSTYRCSYTLMEAKMFDILSTAELTVSASIAMVFLSLAMARTARGRARGSGRARRMVCVGFGDRRDRRAQPRGRGRAGARPHRRFAHRSAGLGLFRPTLCAKRDDCNALARAHRPPCDPPARDSRFSFSTPRAAFPRRLRRARDGAMCSSARPRCRSPGRLRDWARGCGRSSSYGTRSGSPTSSSLSRSGRCRRPVRFRFSSGPPTARR